MCVLAPKGVQAAEGSVCGSEQTNPSPGHERVTAFLTPVLGEKHGTMKICNTILKLLENRGKGSPSPLRAGRNTVSVGSTIRTGGKTQTCVINVQCLLLTQSSTLCRHSGSFLTEALTIKCTNETIYMEDVETHTKSFLSELLQNIKNEKDVFFFENSIYIL